MAFNRVLVPVDLSERTVPSLRLGVALARQLRAELTVLYVAGASEREPGEALQRVIDSVEHHDLALRTLVRTGAPAPTIVELARGERFDLIVLATRSRSGAADYLLGSVALRVIADAPCAVVTLGPTAASDAGP